MFWFFGHEACGILAPQPGTELARPALEGEVLTIGPPGKSEILQILKNWTQSSRLSRKWSLAPNAGLYWPGQVWFSFLSLLTVLCLFLPLHLPKYFEIPHCSYLRNKDNVFLTPILLLQCLTYTKYSINISVLNEWCSQYVGLSLFYFNSLRDLGFLPALLKYWI